MVDFGKLANKAKQALSQHSDKVTGGIDKAAGFAKEKFKGKAEAIENVAEKAKGFVAGQSGKGDARPTDEAGGGGHSSKGASDHGSAGRGPGSPQEGKGSSSPGKSDRESAGDQNTYRWD